jgi:hypothetical protein
VETTGNIRKDDRLRKDWLAMARRANARGGVYLSFLVGLERVTISV